MTAAGSGDDRLRVLSDAMRAFAEASADQEALLAAIAERTARALGGECSVVLADQDGEWMRPAPERGRALFVPMRARGVTLGGLAVVRRGGDGEAFDAGEQQFAQTLADHAALAIASQRLVASVRCELEARTRAEDRLRMLGELAREFSAATSDYRGLLDLIARRLAGLFGDMCVIRFLDDDGHSIADVGAVFHDDAVLASTVREAMLATRHRIGDSPGRRGLYAGQALLVPTLTPGRLAALFAEGELEPLLRIGATSLMLVPIRRGATTVGVVVLARIGTERPYTADDRDLLQDAVVHASLAIRNGKLYARSQAQLAERRRLADRLSLMSSVSREFSLATGDHVGLLDLIARRIGELIGDVAVVRLVAEGGVAFEAEMGVYHADDARRVALREALEALPLPIGEGTTDPVVRDGKPVLIAANTVDELIARAAPAHPAGLRAAGVTSILGVPLMAEGRVFGSIAVYRCRPYAPFGDDELGLARDLVGHASLAISNSRLLREIQRDVIARVQLEERNRRMQEANRLKSEFLANMSHELRTPLNAVIGFASLMHSGKTGPLADHHREYLGDILGSSRHLLQLINDVLDLAKVEAGRVEVRPEPVDLEQTVGEVRDILRGLLADKRLPFAAAIAPGLSPVLVDPRLLKQVLYNFLSNAIKFTPEGGRVELRITPEGAGEFAMAVTDTGIGIRPEDMDRLFVEFQQLDAGVAKRYPGTGLGLALTKRIVEAQGGRVSVVSEPGVGSTFTAVLPRTYGALTA